MIPEEPCSRNTPNLDSLHASGAVALWLGALCSAPFESPGENWLRPIVPTVRIGTVIHQPLNHFRVPRDPAGFRHDKQSAATASSIDYAVANRAFVLDLESHASTGRAGGTAPRDGDDKLIERVFAELDPLFDAYGWADDEFSWTNETCVGRRWPRVAATRCGAGANGRCVGGAW